METKHAPPVFAQAMEDYIRLCQAGQEDSPEAIAAFSQLLRSAPPEFRAQLEQQARDMGLMPPATGYLADGTPVWSAQDLATHFGQPISQVEAQLAAHGLPLDASQIHRPQ